jgi:hypothetical protein
MEPRVMIHLIREIFPNYDIHARTGYPESLSIPNMEVAGQIVSDVLGGEEFPNFLTLLIRAQEEGIMGRKYPVAYLREIIKETFDLGLIYDSVNKVFVEDPKVRQTRNWGILDEGKEYTLAFLSVDIVGNTRLVRTYSEPVVHRAYADLKEIIQNTIIRRNGRIWNWEGDGGLVAFFFGNKHMSAAVSAIEIIHEMYLYNRTRCAMDEPLSIRIGVHAGPCEYNNTLENLERVQTILETLELERKSPSDGVTISVVIKVMLEEIISQKFKSLGNGKNGPFTYQLELAKR